LEKCKERNRKFLIMKLYEKYLELAFAKICSENLARKSTREACDFAIGFALWYESTLRYSDNLMDKFNMEELLQLYKKERGL
tara:strand:+ start:283 stop:528 length:246 start_codon:yes stop_codon:yes gene_type:complete